MWKDKIRNVSWIIIPYRKIRALPKNVKLKIEEQRFAIVGPRKLKKVQALFEAYNEKFFVDMGTLLGIYRDHKLLKRDMDIDMAVYLESEEQIVDFQKYLVNNGCVHTLTFKSVSLGVFQDTFYWDGTRIDVCYYRNEGAKDACFLMYDDDKIVKLTCTKVEKTARIPFGGSMVNAPENVEQYLADRYGTGWRVPDKGYLYWKGPSAYPIDERGTCEHIR